MVVFSFGAEGETHLPLGRGPMRCDAMRDGLSFRGRGSLAEGQTGLLLSASVFGDYVAAFPFIPLVSSVPFSFK